MCLALNVDKVFSAWYINAEKAKPEQSGDAKLQGLPGSQPVADRGQGFRSVCVFRRKLSEPPARKPENGSLLTELCKLVGPIRSLTCFLHHGNGEGTAELRL